MCARRSKGKSGGKFAENFMGIHHGGRYMEKHSRNSEFIEISMISTETRKINTILIKV